MVSFTWKTGLKVLLVVIIIIGGLFLFNYMCTGCIMDAIPTGGGGSSSGGSSGGSGGAAGSGSSDGIIGMIALAIVGFVILLVLRNLKRGRSGGGSSLGITHGGSDNTEENEDLDADKVSLSIDYEDTFKAAYVSGGKIRFRNTAGNLPTGNNYSFKITVKNGSPTPIRNVHIQLKSPFELEGVLKPSNDQSFNGVIPGNSNQLLGVWFTYHVEDPSKLPLGGDFKANINLGWDWVPGVGAAWTPPAAGGP